MTAGRTGFLTAYLALSLALVILPTSAFGKIDPPSRGDMEDPSVVALANDIKWLARGGLNAAQRLVTTFNSKLAPGESAMTLEQAEKIGRFLRTADACSATKDKTLSLLPTKSQRVRLGAAYACAILGGYEALMAAPLDGHRNGSASSGK